MKTKNILLFTLALLSHTFLIGQDDYELNCESDFYITECIGPAFTDSEGELFSKVTATINNSYFNEDNPPSWQNFQDLFDAEGSTYIQWEIDGGTFYSTASNGTPLEDVGTTGYTAIFWPIDGTSYPIDDDDINKVIGEKNITSDEITIEAWIKWDSDVMPEYKMITGDDGEELKNTRMVKAKLKYKGKKYSLTINPSKSKLEFFPTNPNLIVKFKYSFAVGETLCEDLGVFTPTPTIKKIEADEFCYSKEFTLDIIEDFCESFETTYEWEIKTGSGAYQPLTETPYPSLVVSDLSPDLFYSFRVTPVAIYTYQPILGPSSLETLYIRGNSKSIDFSPIDIQPIVAGPAIIESASGGGPVPSGGGVYELKVQGNAGAENVSWRVDPPQYEQYIQEITPTSIIFSPVLPANTAEAHVVISALGDINENCDPSFHVSKSVTIVSSFDGLQSWEDPDQINKVASSQKLGMNESTVLDQGTLIGNYRITKPSHIQNPFSFAPNPSNGDLNIQLSSSDLVQTAEVVIFDLNGKVVLRVELQATSGAQSIDLTVLNNGVYVLGLRRKNGAFLSQFEKLVIQR